MDIIKVVKLLSRLNSLIPSISNIIKHYKELSDLGKLQPEDNEKAKELLTSMRWDKWDDI